MGGCGVIFGRDSYRFETDDFHSAFAETIEEAQKLT